MFLQPNVSSLNFDSLHFYSDLGYANACHQNASGSYMEVVLHVTQMPMGIPLSFCLPPECNKSAYFQPLLDDAASTVNKALNKMKETVNFDDLYHELPSAFFKSSKGQDQQLVSQFTGLVGNVTEVTLTSHVQLDDQEIHQQETQDLWDAVRLFTGVTFVLLCLTPNVVLLIRHGCGCQNRQADVIERDYQQREKLEGVRPEIRRSRATSTEQSCEDVPDFALQLSDHPR